MLLAKAVCHVLLELRNPFLLVKKKKKKEALKKKKKKKERKKEYQSQYFSLFAIMDLCFLFLLFG